MKLSQVSIENFRAIEALQISLDRHTVLIGENGVGKSCVIKAVEKFFEKSVNVKATDFHNNNIGDPIRISLTFTDFSEAERMRFGARIHNDAMSVSRKIYHSASPRDNGKYFGLTPRHPRFQEIRAIEGAVQRRQAYGQIRESAPYDSLPTVTNDAQVQAAMSEWEAQNPDLCQLDEDDGQFFLVFRMSVEGFCKNTSHLCLFRP